MQAVTLRPRNNPDPMTWKPMPNLLEGLDMNKIEVLDFIIIILVQRDLAHSSL